MAGGTQDLSRTRERSLHLVRALCQILCLPTRSQLSPFALPVMILAYSNTLVIITIVMFNYTKSVSRQALLQLLQHISESWKLYLQCVTVSKNELA